MPEPARVAILTGANGGLGSTVFPMFREAGFRVAATGLNWSPLPDESDEFFAMDLDLTTPGSAAQLAQRTLA